MKMEECNKKTSFTNILLNKKISATLALIRFPATIITAGLVGLFATFTMHGSLNPPIILIAFFAYFFISGSGFVINDYFDIDIDSINKPSRPLPAGLISKREALYIYVLMFIGSIILSLRVNSLFATIAIPNAVLNSIYSVYFKRYGGILANIIMGIYAALVVLSGISISGSLSITAVGYATSLFLYMVGAQIIMGIEDIKGDSLNGARTLPVTIGLEKSMVIAVSLMLIALVLLFGTIRTPYEIIPILTILGINSYIFFSIVKYPSPEVAKKLRVFMALSMILANIIIIIRM